MTAEPTGGTTAEPTGGTTATPKGGTTATPTGGTTATPKGGTTATPPSLEIERRLARPDCGPVCGPICGIDEVGRGPWAGPVVAAAVILDPAAVPEGLNDSKLVPRLRREALAAELAASAVVGVGSASVEEIERLNILQASLLAMARAVAALALRPAYAVVDGNQLPAGLPCPALAVPKGDGSCLSIAAASIVAKVARDRMMAELAAAHPGYGWETNMGYGTPAHAEALARLGLTPHHRRGFRPIHNMLWEEAQLSP